MHVTRQLREAAKAVDIDLLDNVIIGRADKIEFFRLPQPGKRDRSSGCHVAACRRGNQDGRVRRRGALRGVRLVVYGSVCAYIRRAARTAPVRPVTVASQLRSRSMSPENKQALVNDEAWKQVGVMKTTLRVSRRGTFTLPAGMRRKLGLKLPDAVVVVEECDGGLFLRPALPTRKLSKKQVAKWIKRDEAEMAEFRSTRRAATI